MDIQDLQQKYRPTTSKNSSVFNCTYKILFYPCVHQTHLECFIHLTIEAGPI